MTIYTDIRDGVFAYTGRDDLTAETDTAIRQAVRTAHSAGSFWRDLVTLSLTNLDTTQPIQTIDLSTVATDFRQLAHVGPTDGVGFYDPVDIKDLMDSDNQYKTDVCYGMGTNLIIRPATPVASVTLVYWKFPVVSPITSLNSWIAEKYPDLIILWAAATVLALVNETDIKARVEALAKIEYASLIANNLLIERR